MVAYAVTRNPQFLAAAIELYGVVDRELFVYRTNHPSAIRWMMEMGGTPTEQPDAYTRANVLKDIDKVQTPLLIMLGEMILRSLLRNQPRSPELSQNTIRSIVTSPIQECARLLPDNASPRCLKKASGISGALSES